MWAEVRGGVHAVSLLALLTFVVMLLCTPQTYQMTWDGKAALIVQFWQRASRPSPARRRASTGSGGGATSTSLLASASSGPAIAGIEPAVSPVNLSQLLRGRAASSSSTDSRPSTPGPDVHTTPSGDVDASVGDGDELLGAGAVRCDPPYTLAHPPSHGADTLPVCSLFLLCCPIQLVRARCGRANVGTGGTAASSGTSIRGVCRSCRVGVAVLASDGSAHQQPTRPTAVHVYRQ